MSNNSKIEWCDATWNPIVGCSKVSPGCANCYAERMACRLACMGQVQYQQVVQGQIEDYPKHWNGKTAFVESALVQLMKWRKPRRIFVCSMGDLFHESVPLQWIVDVFGIMAACSQHTFIVLTKRPQRMAKIIDDQGDEDCPISFRERVDDAYCANEGTTAYTFKWPLPNVWLGTSVENQATADQRIPHLLKCPAAVRFVSAEPLLDSIDLERSGFMGHKHNERCSVPCHVRPGAADSRLVIVGGESGPGARPCNVEWIRSIVSQCKAAGVPVFVKQLGAKPHDQLSDSCGWRTDAIAKWPPTVIYHQRIPDASTHLIVLSNKKGGDPSEWPEDLRVRQWPEVGK